jgi:hypothetical protein
MTFAAMVLSDVGLVLLSHEFKYSASEPSSEYLCNKRE